MLKSLFEKELDDAYNFWGQIKAIKVLLKKPIFKKYFFLSEFIEDLENASLTSLNFAAHDPKLKVRKIEDIKSSFNYIVCKKNIKINQFPVISFYHTELDYVFELSYEDVFSNYNGKIYFLCINEVNKNEKWVFGKPFFKKYNIIFDHSAKTIGLYAKKKNKMNWIVIEWIIAVILLFVLIMLAYTLIKRYRLNHINLLKRK